MTVTVTDFLKVLSSILERYYIQHIEQVLQYLDYTRIPVQNCSGTIQMQNQAGAEHFKF